MICNQIVTWTAFAILAMFYLTSCISIEANLFANMRFSDHRAGLNSNIIDGEEKQMEVRS